MQLLPCPFCGPRGEAEFHYLGEDGKTRPTTAASATEWTAYLYGVANRRGASRELWLHRTCGEIFRMTRDTTTGSVLDSASLRGPQAP